MRRIEITVPGQPIAQPRARATMIGGRAHIYTPRTGVKAFKEACRIMFAAVHQGPPLDGPVYVEIRAVFARPKRLVFKKRPMLQEWHPTKPDFDNVAKACADSLKGIACRDDSQIALAGVKKVYALSIEQQHTRGTITHVQSSEASEF